MCTIVVAGGRGRRFGRPKQFDDLAGRSVLARSVEVAAAVSDRVVVVVPADAVAEVSASSSAAAAGGAGEVVVVAGGDSRAASVRAGLAAAGAAEVLVVHDAARPLATPALFGRVVDAVRGGAVAVVPAVPVTDTIRRRGGGVVDRDELLAVQTPQGFAAAVLRSAHAGGGEATDDATMVEQLGQPVTVVDGEVTNIKITHPRDLAVAAALLASEAM